VEPDVITVLENFLEGGLTWDEAALDGLSESLAGLDGSPVAELAGGISGVRRRLAAGGMTEPQRREVEAVIYPKLWKVLEAVRSGLPEGEQRARVQVLNRGLARLASEADIL
jgi:hypothetical protein